jgi:hypothetical protein
MHWAGAPVWQVAEAHKMFRFDRFEPGARFSISAPSQLTAFARFDPIAASSWNGRHLRKAVLRKGRANVAFGSKPST